MPLSKAEQDLFDQLVQVMEHADRSPTPDLALALHYGEEAPSGCESVNRISDLARSAIQHLAEKNPDGLREAIAQASPSAAFRFNAILGVDAAA